MRFAFVPFLAHGTVQHLQVTVSGGPIGHVSCALGSAAFGEASREHHVPPPPDLKLHGVPTVTPSQLSSTGGNAGLGFCILIMCTVIARPICLGSCPVTSPSSPRPGREFIILRRRGEPPLIQLFPPRAFEVGEMSSSSPAHFIPSRQRESVLCLSPPSVSTAGGVRPKLSVSSMMSRPRAMHAFLPGASHSSRGGGRWSRRM